MRAIPTDGRCAATWLAVLLLVPSLAHAQDAPSETGSETESATESATEAAPPGRGSGGGPAAETESATESAPPPPGSGSGGGPAADTETEVDADEDTRPDVAVLSIGGDASRAQARAARQAVAEALAEDGMTPVPDADIALSIPPARFDACRETACAHAFAAELGVSMIAAVTTWAGESGPSSITVSLVLGPRRAYSATEDVGEAGLPAAARAAVTGAQDGRRRAILVEGASSGPDPEDVEDPDPVATSVLQRDRSLEEWILPSLLGVVGIGLVGLSVYALLPQQCERRGATICLRGSEPNIGLGIVMAVTGALSIAGAVLWLIVGGQPPDSQRIDVVLGPDGGAVGYVGVF